MIILISSPRKSARFSGADQRIRFFDILKKGVKFAVTDHWRRRLRQKRIRGKSCLFLIGRQNLSCLHGAIRGKRGRQDPEAQIAAAATRKLFIRLERKQMEKTSALMALNPGSVPVYLHIPEEKKTFLLILCKKQLILYKLYLK